MGEHTPGPWHYGEDQRGKKRVYAGDHEIVRALSTHGYRHKVPSAERDANARLIAAAPDMLAALKAIRAAFQVEYYPDGRVMSVGYDNEALRPVVAQLDAALAKASQ